LLQQTLTLNSQYIETYFLLPKILLLHHAVYLLQPLVTPGAAKALQLYKGMGKSIPVSVRNTLKVNANMSNQVLFITNGTAGPTVQKFFPC
jgi:hypothetical protein